MDSRLGIISHFRPYATEFTVFNCDNGDISCKTDYVRLLSIGTLPRTRHKRPFVWFTMCSIEVRLCCPNSFADSRLHNRIFSRLSKVIQLSECICHCVGIYNCRKLGSVSLMIFHVSNLCWLCYHNERSLWNCCPLQFCGYERWACCVVEIIYWIIFYSNYLDDIFCCRSYKLCFYVHWYLLCSLVKQNYWGMTSTTSFLLTLLNM